MGFFTWFFIRMKKIMFSKNKSKICLWLFFSFLCWIVGIWYVYAATFSGRLSDVGIDTVSFSDKNSISRYEVARLLNAANCQDCVQAPEWMKQKYTQDYWNNFRAIDWKDFDDVDYGAWVWNKKSYYYCVAYIADNGYMAWYPSTSTKCKWSFCGQDSITTSEFYQTVLNIIQPQIRQRYLIDWSKVKAWKKWLKKNSIQMKVLNQSNIDVIDKAESKIAYAESNEEFQTWLKYCMYNLSECNFQSFGVIWTGYWPVSELNILYKEWIISLEDAQNVASFPNMKWSEAIRIFSAVYDNYSSCSFNVDYDCDGIVNWKDNCPYMYNPNQYDLDGDRIWNVCDNDIDWDWSKNPIWIVDDNNRVIISLWDDKSDVTPMAWGDLWFSFFINVDAISSWFPTNVKFVPLTDWNISKIEWDFGDWTREVVDNGNKVNHIFGKSGFFTVKAVATSKSGTKSFAMTKVFITDSKTENYALNIKPSLVFKNWSVEYTFTPLSLGDLDEISWNVNDQWEVTKKLTETFKTTIKENGRYVVTAKWYKNWELKAIAMFTMLQSWSPKFISMDVKTWNLWEQSSVTSNLMWILREEIDHININWWWVSTDSSDTVQKYVYDEAWLKTIQHNIVLKDGTVLYNLATITVKNPLLSQSYAMNVVWDRLWYNQGDNLALWLTMYPKTPVMSLFTSYQVWQKRFIYNPDFSKLLLDFTYADAWDKLLTNSVEVNRCVALVNQWTVHINAVDICENAMKNKSLSKYKCDQDWDKIPDICDDDIDWDGVKNLVGIILYENKDCSIWENNINSDLLKKQLWVCSLDNCPFVVNPNQSDLNNNWIWEVCEDAISKLLSSSLSSDEWSATLVLDRDQDWDGVADGVDECIDIPWNSSNWCPEYYSQNCWVYSSCGNGVVDEWENCQNCPQDAWVCCGNGTLESWENCKTCPQDAGDCHLCWNGKINKWENCRNCEEDVWKCSAYCGNGEIEAAEDCRNCEKDVWKCSAYCGNGEIEAAEDCDNCSKDVELCRRNTCGNWVVDEWAWEECDSNKDKNWNDVKCTKMCTIYDENKPNCGNGKIDKWEDCDTCSVDLWEKCVAEWENGKLKTCGNKKIDKGENCKNCEEDVWKCTAYCGNWEIEAAEDCRNCEKDVWKCSAYCGNEKIEKWEDCNNCSKDVKLCRSIVYGNWVVDERAWEECDSGKDKDWNDVECTKMWTIYDENKPNCGNGEIDKWEDCDMCPVDLWEKCVAGWEKAWNLCWDWVLNWGEQCDFRDDTKANWWTQWCSNSCQKVDKDSWECNTMYDWMNLTRLINSSDLCDRWVLRNFSFNANKLQWTRLCVNDNTNLFVKCFAKKSGCGDWVIWNDEKCYNCSLDLRDICVTDWDYSEDENCKCGECPEKLKSICIDDWEDDDEENCKCGECPEKLKERCIKPDDVDIPDIIQSPDEPQISEDDWWYVENDNCSACPCEYVDFSTELTKWDTVRAKLWDKSLSVFYRYSNSTALETFIDVEWFNGVISSTSQVVWNKNDTNVSVSQDAWNGGNDVSQTDNSEQTSQTPWSTSLERSSAKVEPLIGKRWNEVVREYTTEVNNSDASLKTNLNVVSQYQQAIGFNSPKYNYEESLYLDSAIFKKWLDLIKDNQNFTIKVSINAWKEYVLVVQNRVNNVVVRAIISESAISDFEKYCKSVLGIDLNSMFGGLLSESKNTWEEGNTNSQTDASKQTSQTPWSVSLAKSNTNSNIKITKQSDRVVRTYTTELSKTDSAMKIYLKEVEDYQTAIWFNAHNFYEQVLYLDSATFKKWLNLIKDNPDFTITIQKNDKKEYILAITNRGNNAVISTTIPQSVSAEFETYCKNILWMDLSWITKEQKTVDFMDMLDKVSNGRG